MPPIKLLILLAVISFCAYTGYEADKEVRTLRVHESRTAAAKNDLMGEDFEHMNRAIKLSHFSHAHLNGNPAGSVVVKDGQIIGEGWDKTSVGNDPSAHAEIEAIRNACKKLSSSTLQGCVIYSSSQACPMCLSLIYLTGIEKVFYGMSGNKADNRRKVLPADRIFEAFSKHPMDRPIPEIAIVPKQIENVRLHQVN